jgi:hypothetical protein
MTGYLWTITQLSLILMQNDTIFIGNLLGLATVPRQSDELIPESTFSDGSETRFLVKVQRPGWLCKLFLGGLLAKFKDG